MARKSKTGVLKRLREVKKAEKAALKRDQKEQRKELAGTFAAFEAVAALLGATDSLVRCPACGRILYMNDEMRGALAKK